MIDGKESKTYSDASYQIFETDAKGAKWPIGSVVTYNGANVFWRDFDYAKFVFRKNNYTAIYQDDVLIEYLMTTPVKEMYFHDFRNKRIYKATIDQFKSARVVNMRGRRQRGLSLQHFEELTADRLPEVRRPEASVIVDKS